MRLLTICLTLALGSGFFAGCDLFKPLEEDKDNWKGDDSSDDDIVGHWQSTVVWICGGLDTIGEAYNGRDEMWIEDNLEGTGWIYFNPTIDDFTGLIECVTVDYNIRVDIIDPDDQYSIDFECAATSSMTPGMNTCGFWNFYMDCDLSSGILTCTDSLLYLEWEKVS
jgi:hypothetical protein